MRKPTLLLLIFFVSAINQQNIAIAAEEPPPSDKGETQASPIESSGGSNISNSVAVATSIGTFFLACIVTATSCLQYVTNREKLKLDRFDKRFAVYDSVRHFLSLIGSTGNVTQEEINQFKLSTGESVFLFSDDKLEQFLKDLIPQANKLMVGNQVIAHINETVEAYSGEEHREKQREHKTEVMNAGEILEWFSNKHKELVPLFEPHLKFKN